MNVDLLVLILLFVAIVVIWVFFTPLKIRANIDANALKQSAKIKARFMFFGVHKSVLCFEGDDLVLVTKRKKRLVIINPFVKIGLAPKIIVWAVSDKQLSLDFFGGVSGNDYMTSMICGTASALFALLRIELYGNKHIALDSTVSPKDGDALRLKIEFVGYIPLAKIFAVFFIVLANTILRKIKHKKEK